MRKLFFAKTAAVMLCTVLCAAPLNACGHKEVSLEDDTSDVAINFTAPAVGEDIVVLTIQDYGEVKIKLFYDESPKGAENFKTHAQNGYYDELIFHRVISNFMIQGGDPKGNGTGGVDCWGNQGFEQTISAKLHHFAGAVAYAVNAQDKLNGSQFYIVTGEETTSEKLAAYGLTYGPVVQKLYEQFGGVAYLDGGYEIFGQVFDGLEYCLEIQNVETNSSDKPKTPVVIEKAEVVQYDGSPITWLNWQGEAQNIDSSEG